MEMTVDINELVCGVVCSQRSATVISILPLPQELSSRLFERHSAQYVFISVSVSVYLHLSAGLLAILAEIYCNTSSNAWWKNY